MENRMPSDRIALEFRGVTGAYRRYPPVFRDLSFTIREGSVTGVIGPNGSGKTSLLRAATGLLDEVTGQVRVFGNDVLSLPARRRASLVGVVPQDTHTPMAYTVEEIVSMGRTHAMSRWRSPTTADHLIVEKAMAYTDVIDMRDRPFPELSGGERQRTVIAMVLAQQPRLILMDEATSRLDINHRLEIMQLIERLNRDKGVTVLMISHDLNLAAEFSERLLLLDRGQLVADGSPAEVLTEANLRQVYRCNATVQANPLTGSVMITPSPRLAAARSGKGVRVHVVVGGGCGEEVIRRLVLCDYTVTVGVVNRGDSDAAVATALECEAAFEQPFSPVGSEAQAECKRLCDAARAIVIPGVPFGPGNVANLEVALAALQAGTAVLMMAEIEARDYTPDRRATAIAAELRSHGAREWRTVTDLLGML